MKEIKYPSQIFMHIYITFHKPFSFIGKSFPDPNTYIFTHNFSKI